MKIQFRKKIFTILVSFATLLTFGQENNKFYASIDDYNNNKPISGYDIVSSISGSENFKVKTNGGEAEKMKVSKFPSDFFTYDGVLLRRFDGNSYYVLVNGSLCYYLMKNEADVFKAKVKGEVRYIVNRVENTDAQGNYISKTPSDYYSEKLTGEISKLKEKVLEKYLTQYALLDSYEKEKPKREAKDNVNGYHSKEVAHKVKFINTINEKAK